MNETVYSLFLMTAINILAHRKLEKVLLHGFFLYCRLVIYNN